MRALGFDFKNLKVIISLVKIKTFSRSYVNKSISRVTDNNKLAMLPIYYP